MNMNDPEDFFKRFLENFNRNEDSKGEWRHYRLNGDNSSDFFKLFWLLMSTPPPNHNEFNFYEKFETPHWDDIFDFKRPEDLRKQNDRIHLKTLESLLERAIEIENYEDAAKYRDLIKEIKEKNQ